MDVLRINGGRRLIGSVDVSGAKNAALPILAATILADGPCCLENVPSLTDVDTMSLLLGHLGVEVKRRADGRVDVQTIDAMPTRAPRSLVRCMRASFCVLGPLLARRGHAVVPLPGGCEIGPRPVDLHLRGLEELGANIIIRGDRVIARAKRLRGTTIDLLGICGPTVTGTANVLSAAVLARGQSVLLNAAREPEIVDLCEFLCAMGAKISGLGTSTLIVDGVPQLHGAAHRIIPDRIEAATLLMAGAITGGEVCVRGLSPLLLSRVLTVLQHAGAEIEAEGGNIALRMSVRPRAVDLRALPFPGFPTDLQAQWMALMSVADGRCQISDDVFAQRFAHVAELTKFGAKISSHNDGYSVRGIAALCGATVRATDLRASAALVLAALAADGETIIRQPRHLDRGYQQFDAKLASLGASIQRIRDFKPVARNANGTSNLGRSVPLASPV